MITLTDDQRAAIRTWRKGLRHSIVSGLPFTDNDELMATGLSEWHGGSYLVCESKIEPVLDFILSAAHAAAEDEHV